MNIEYLLGNYRLAHDPILGIITLYVNLIERLLCAKSFWLILIDFLFHKIQVWMTFMFCSQAEQRTFGKSFF